MAEPIDPKVQESIDRLRDEIEGFLDVTSKDVSWSTYVGMLAGLNGDITRLLTGVIDADINSSIPWTARVAGKKE
jgi:hypothetical protein